MCLSKDLPAHASTVLISVFEGRHGKKDSWDPGGKAFYCKKTCLGNSVVKVTKGLQYAIKLTANAGHGCGNVGFNI